jgi:hypothetical protein
LRECGATEDECSFLVHETEFRRRRGKYRWEGERVEINAMASDQLVSWLEGKLSQSGVCKVVPDSDTVAAAYRKAKLLAAIQTEVDRVVASFPMSEIAIPDDLPEQVSLLLDQEPRLSWDEATERLARDQASEPRVNTQNPDHPEE